MIVGRRHRLVKDIRKLKACKGDRALLEGPHLVGEAIAAGLPLLAVLATPEFLASPPGGRIAAALPIAPAAITPAALAAVTDADSPRGVLAVAELPRGGPEALQLVEDGVYLYLAGLQDPGNLGAVARAAEAAGAAGLALAPGSAHPNHPRALRASAGSLLRLPVAIGSEPAALAARLTPLAPRWLALAPTGGQPLWTAPLHGSLVLALGAEGPGLPPEIAARAQLVLSVPMAPPVESLNVAVAAAVVMFEVRRRRAAEAPSAPGEAPLGHLHRDARDRIVRPGEGPARE